ncbi:protein-lysine N-methyltransferase Efm3p [Diutina catenulata]
MFHVQHLYQRVPPQFLDYAGAEPKVVLEALRKYIIPYNPEYARKALQKWVDFGVPEDYSDEAYEILGELMVNRGQQKEIDTLGYCLGSSRVIFIEETPNVISGQSTTGLRTWEAAVFLSQYIHQHLKDQFEGQTVLELGAGTGLVGLSVLADTTTTKVIMTDGTASLIDRMGTSFTLNHLDRDRVAFQQLWWGQDTIHQPVDYIVGADITYDASVVPALVATIKESFANNGTKRAYIAATIRNQETIAAWDKCIADMFDVKVLVKCTTPHANTSGYWYRTGTPEIRIYEIAPVN